MSSSIGENIRLTLFGQSHGPVVGMTLDGIPAGKRIDADILRRFLARRAPHGQPWATARTEADEPDFLSGLVDWVTCGAPLTAVIRNTDARPSDYACGIPRPSHADYTAHIKYGGFEDAAGGGHLSGRLTAAFCTAGGICMQLLEAEGIRIISRIASVAEIEDDGELLSSTADLPFPTVNAERGRAMITRITDAGKSGNSVGGVIECAVLGVPAGLGDPVFGGMGNRISALVFGIPGIKGIEFGAGFASSRMTGAENNDVFRVENGRIITRTNRCGGILGGITDGMPVTFRAAVKPTPSVSRPQQSVALDTLTDTSLTVTGRHDPCIVPRAVPCVEAAAALAVYDAFLGRKREL